MALLYDRHLAADFLLYTTLWIVPVFALVTLFLELLRDRNGYRLSAINLPVTVTLLRLALVPGLFLFLVRGHFRTALLVYGLASLTDIVDGWAARRWNQVTRLGTVLDPQVDIVFSLALVLALLGGRRAARLAVRASRRCATQFYCPAPPTSVCSSARSRSIPRCSGRLTGVVITALIAMLLTLHALGGRLGGHLRDRLETLTVTALAVLPSATVIHVLALGWYNLRVMTGAAAGARGRVVGMCAWGPSERGRLVGRPARRSRALLSLRGDAAAPARAGHRAASSFDAPGRARRRVRRGAGVRCSPHHRRHGFDRPRCCRTAGRSRARPSSAPWRSRA
mgnify:CR=1 FL=1